MTDSVHSAPPLAPLTLDEAMAAALDQGALAALAGDVPVGADRKSTRLNSSHPK